MKIYILWIASRQLFSLNKKAGLFFMTLASLLGVTIGISALIVTLSVMGGFEQDLRTKIFRGLPHIEFTNKIPNIGFSLIDYPVGFFTKLIPQHTSAQEFIKSEIIIKNDNNIISATMLGINLENPGDIWGIKQSISFNHNKTQSLHQLFHSMTNISSNQTSTSYGLMMGSELAMNLGVEIGDKILVLYPQSDLAGFLGGEKFFEEFQVIQIFFSKKSEYDSHYVVTDINSARRYMDDYDSILDQQLFVTGVAINLDNPENVDRINLHNLPSQLEATTWKQANSSLLGALLLEKIAMGTMLFLIVIVAIFSLSGTVMMTVYYKRTLISLLRGLGMTWKDVVKIFIAQGTLIGIIGIISGLAFGLGLCYLVKEVGIISLPQGIYQLQKLPVKFLFYEYIIICLLAFGLIIIASIYPAMIAGKQNPSDALRY